MPTPRSARLGLTLVIPCALASAAWFAATGIASLVEASIPTAIAAPPPEAARSFVSATKPSADAIVDRNPFEHAGPKAMVANGAGCDGVKPLVIVAAAEPSLSFAAIEYEGRRVLRKRNDDLGGRRVAFIGRDRVWLESNDGRLCEARLYGGGAAATTNTTATMSVATTTMPGIVRRSATEIEIDRATLDRLLESQAELGKARVIPEKEGVRLLAVKPGSVLAQIGLESGDRLETINGFSIANPQEALEAYARLRGADHLTLHLTRNGRPLNLDYSIR